MILLANREDAAFASLVKTCRDNKLWSEDEEYVGHFYTLWHTEDDQIQQIAILFEQEKPIGVAATWTYPDSEEVNIGVYIVPEYRRKGYGTVLVQQIEGDYVWRLGEEGSGEFWTSLQQ